MALTGNATETPAVRGNRLIRVIKRVLTLPRTPVRRLDAAAAAYLQSPGTDTLEAFLAACRPALNQARRSLGPKGSARVIQKAALAHSLAYYRLGGTSNADVAAELLARLADHGPSDDMRCAAQVDLATLGFTRYIEDGEAHRLESCIARYEDALRNCPAGFRYRPVILGGLGNALVELDQRDNRRSVLDRAIDLHDEALSGLSGGDPNRTALLTNLATALLARYRRASDPADLRRAASVHAEIAERADVDEQVLVARAELLWERYAAEDDPDLLAAAIATLVSIVDTLPDDVPLWRTAALNLANAQLERQWRFGEDDAAGTLLEEAARVTPHGTPDWARVRHGEGLQHWQMYLTSGDLGQLAEALAAWRDAAEAVPKTHVLRASLLNSVAIGVLQQVGHGVEGELRIAAAEEAVAAAQRAVDAAAPTTTASALAWNTLGYALSLRYHCTANPADATAAVTAWRCAVSLSPPGFRGRAGHLNGLATGLRERAAADASSAGDDLREAVALHRQAVELMTESTELSGLLANLGMSLHGLAAATADTDAYVEAVDAFRRAVTAGRETTPGQALDAALGWLRMATDGVPVWADVATASDAALDAIRRLSRSQVLRADKETWLRSTTNVSAWAARAQLELGHPAAATTALEIGRGLVLSDALPPLMLGRTHPDLLKRFRRAIAAVERLDQPPDRWRATAATAAKK